MTTPSLDHQPVIRTPYRGWFADPRPLRNLAAETRLDRDEPAHRLSLADLVALSPLMRPWQLRVDTAVNPPSFFDPRRGFTRTPHRRIHAVRLPRAFSLDTLVGTVHGSEDDYLLLAATGAVSTLSEPELLACYEPLARPVDNDELPAWAARVAAGLLGPLGERWRHTVTAARHAEQLAGVLPSTERAALIAAVWLHDIGYAPALAATGLHHLDAALTLDGLIPARVVGLVAHHSAGDAEAELCHMSIALDCFPGEHSAISDALTYCDLTSGPEGRPMRPADAIDDAIRRFGTDHVVARALQARRADLLAACTRAARPGRGTRYGSWWAAHQPGPEAAPELVAEPVEIIGWLRDHGVMVKDIAAALGTRSNRICEWQSGARHLTPRAYTMLATLRDVVAEAGRHLSGNEVARWLRTSNPSLDGNRPLDLIRPDGARVQHSAELIGGGFDQARGTS
ncbi:MAG: antitoxin Xre/MbcA/ParS toxin-binding domain-containing protein [Mycobacteriales bacterium]